MKTVTLDTKIQDLKVTRRVKGLLLNLHVETVRDLLQYSEAELMREMNFGKISLAELRAALGGPSIEEVNDIIRQIRKLRAERAKARKTATAKVNKDLEIYDEKIKKLHQQKDWPYLKGLLAIKA